MTAQNFPDRSQKTTLIVGNFSLSSATQPRHTAQTLCLLETRLNHRVVAVAVSRGMPADSLLGPASPIPRTDGALVYLKVMAQLPPSPAGWRRRIIPALGRARILLRILHQTPHSVLVRETGLYSSFSGLLILILGRIANLVIPWRVHIVSLTEGAEKAIWHLTGSHADPLPATEADETAFAHLRSNSPDILRLTRGLCVRALDAAQIVPDAALRRDFVLLAAVADTLDPHALIETWLGTSNGEVPDALKAALQTDTQGLTGLDRHLKLLRTNRGRAANAPKAQIAEQVLGFRLSPRVPPRQIGALDSFAQQIALQFSRSAAQQYPKNPAEQFLSNPMGGDPANISRRNFLALLLFRAPIRAISAFRNPWRCDELATWVAGTLGSVAPAFAVHQHAGVEVVGPATAATGIGQNLWMSVAALRSAGLPVSVIPVPADEAPDATRATRQMRKSVVLHHLNADRIPQMIAGRYRHRHSFHIGYLLWEFDRLPRVHHLALDMLDEIWVPTQFLAEAYANASKRPVYCMKKAIQLPSPRLPEPSSEKTGFLVCLDFHSSVERKNPLAAVQAFQRAFPKDPDLRLTIKTTPTAPNHWGDPHDQIGAIRITAAHDPRIRLIEEHLPFDALIGLIADADALISPHRAEGFGYFPAYALALGTPVIATDWSGTRDFCTERTACPVPYRLVPVPPYESIYPVPGAKWAQIDIDALAEAMRVHHTDLAILRERAGQGQMLMRTAYSQSALTRRYLDRLAAIGALGEMAEPALDAVFP